MSVLDKLKDKNISPSTLNLYIKNLIRLNDDEEIKNFNFLKDSKKILEKIKNKSENTQRTYIISIVSLLKEQTEPKNKKLYDTYYKILIEFNNKLKNNTEKSEKQEQNWISQDEVQEIYNKLEEAATPYLLAKRKKDATAKEWTHILDWFVLGLYVCQPPRRNIDFILMMVIKTFSPEMDKQYNYYSLDDNTMYFNNFKTQKTYKLQTIVANDKVKENFKKYLENHPLRAQIKKLKINQFVPLLVNFEGHPVESKESITRILNKIFDKKVGSSMLRNIYLTDKYSAINKEKQEDAANMGTSTGTMDNNYIKEVNI